MGGKKTTRNKWIHIRVTETELKKIQTGFNSSTCRKRSEYVRDILLQKPITIYTRNKSYDDFVAEVILLKNELKAIGNNFNQTVKKLHTLEHDNEIKNWALINEHSKEFVFKKISEIQQKINQIKAEW